MGFVDNSFSPTALRRQVVPSNVSQMKELQTRTKKKQNQNRKQNRKQSKSSLAAGSDGPAARALHFMKNRNKRSNKTFGCFKHP